MSFHFIIGRSGTGKTEHCFGRIVSALRENPLGPPIFWILPRQATFTAERRLTCASGLPGFCRARVLSFDQLGEEIIAECGGSAVPEVSAIGRQMILGHLLRRHAADLIFFKPIDRHAGLAAELDRTFDELERSGQTSVELTRLIEDLSHSSHGDVDAAALRNKLIDLRLLHEAYLAYLGQDRLDQHRRLAQILKSVSQCASLRRATFYVDGFYEFTEHERRLMCSAAEAGATICVTLLTDPASPILKNHKADCADMSLFHRTETAYRRLRAAIDDAGIAITSTTILRENQRSQCEPLRWIDRVMFESGPADQTAAPPAMVNVATPVMAGAARPTAIADATCGVDRIEAPDRGAEVDAVARRVAALLKEGYRLRDIAVLTRNLDAYDAAIAMSFGEQGIGYFVDRRRTASHHPLLQLLRGVLGAASRNWEHAAVMSLMKTGLAGLSPDEADALENYVLLHRVVAGQWNAQEPWAWRADLLRPQQAGADVAPDQDPHRIDALRRRLASGLAPLVELMQAQAQRPLKRMVGELFAVFDRLNVSAKLGDWMGPAPGEDARAMEERQEHESLWNELVDLFDQMVDLLGDEPVLPADFIEIVEAGLDRFDLGITPPTTDQVLVGQIDRTRAPAVKAVFVLGLSEGEFPAAPRQRTVLNERERHELSHRRVDLDPHGRRQLLDERLLGYISFTLASRRLTLSRATNDEKGHAIDPSVFWRRIEQILPDVPTEIVSRSGAGDLGQIATPRQLVAGLMQWVRNAARDIPPEILRAPPADHAPAVEVPTAIRKRGRARAIAQPDEPTLFDRISPPAPPQPAEPNPAPRPGDVQPARTIDLPAPLADGLALYHWLATRGQQNPVIQNLCDRAWPALTYSNVARLSRDVAQRLFPEPLRLTARQLESMAACPFQHFARFGLNLAPREKATVSGLDLSQAYHRLLDRLLGQALRRPRRPDGMLDIRADEIHSAALQVATALRGELFLTTARNRYLLARIEETLAHLIDSHNARLRRSTYRPLRVGLQFGELGVVAPIAIDTPSGRAASAGGRIDRVDVAGEKDDVITIDYRLSADGLSMERAYHGLALSLVTQLLALTDASMDLSGQPLAPLGAFELPLGRKLQDVKHPGEAAEPASQAFLLRNKPRGIFAAGALRDLDTELSAGEKSPMVAVQVRRDNSIASGERNDIVSTDDLSLLLRHIRRKMGVLADQIGDGVIDIRPYRLNRQSPCAQCEQRSVCRFETSSNRYHHLLPYGRREAIETMREEVGRAQ